LSGYSVLELTSATVAAPKVKTAVLLTIVNIIMWDNDGIKSIERLPGHKDSPEKESYPDFKSRNNFLPEAVYSRI